MNRPRIRLGDLSVAFTQSLAQAVEHCGQSGSQLLAQFGLDPARLSEAQARLSIPRFMHLGHAAISLTSNPALGLLMGELSHFSQAGLAGITAAQAPNVREAARVLTRFEPLYAHNYRGQSSFLEDSGGAWLCFYSISPYNSYNRFVVDSVLASWACQLSQLCAQPPGRCLPIERVEIEFTAPDYSERYSPLFQCPVEFSAKANRLRLSQTSLALRNPQHCPSTWQHLLQLCEEALQQRTRTRNLSERVGQLLGPLLQGHEPTLADIARRLQIPAWTLRRRLAEEGTQFRQLLNDTRRDLAMTYIRDTELAFGEIAYLLGFTSAAAFQRAFKRWSSTTPGEYRRSQRQSV